MPVLDRPHKITKQVVGPCIYGLHYYLVLEMALSKMHRLYDSNIYKVSPTLCELLQ